jgi:hypothetical protein
MHVCNEDMHSKSNGTALSPLTRQETCLCNIRMDPHLAKQIGRSDHRCTSKQHNDTRHTQY